MFHTSMLSVCLSNNQLKSLHLNADSANLYVSGDENEILDIVCLIFSPKMYYSMTCP